LSVDKRHLYIVSTWEIKIFEAVEQFPFTFHRDRQDISSASHTLRVMTGKSLTSTTTHAAKEVLAMARSLEVLLIFVVRQNLQYEQPHSKRKVIYCLYRGVDRRETPVCKLFVTCNVTGCDLAAIILKILVKYIY
jgi:hypothetical protein